MSGFTVALIAGAILGIAGMKIFGINAVLVRIYNDRKDVTRRR